MSSREVLRQDISERVNRCVRDRLQCRDNELNLRNDCVTLIVAIRDSLPMPLQVKYDKMSWPADPAKHCLMLLDWCGEPRFKIDDTIFSSILRLCEENEDVELECLSQRLLDSVLTDDKDEYTSETPDKPHTPVHSNQ